MNEDTFVHHAKKVWWEKTRSDTKTFWSKNSPGGSVGWFPPKQHLICYQVFKDA